MATSALTIMIRGARHDQRDFHFIPQADQAITQFCFLIEGLDLILQMTQLANGARQTVAGADQAYIMPHDILNRLHVTLNQCRIRIVDQSTFIPRWNILAAWDWE